MSLLKKAYTNNYFKSNLNYAPDLLGSVCLNDDNSANSKCTLIYKYACPSCFSKQEGEYCDVDQECITNFCQQNPPDAPMPVCEQCGGDNICHDNNTCEYESGKCRLKDGELCKYDSECISNLCWEQALPYPKCAGCMVPAQCHGDNEICNLDTRKCLLKTGEQCDYDAQCNTNFCSGDVTPYPACATCNPSTNCSNNKTCDFDTGKCLLETGEPCGIDEQCITNFCRKGSNSFSNCATCSPSTKYQDNKTCDLESGKCLLKTGEPCESDEQCITNFCPSSNPVCSTCSYTEKCTDDKICDPETKKCLLRTGEPCHSDEQCVTNFCPSSNSVCSTCGPSMKCNGDKICDPNVLPVISGNKKCGTLENLCKSNFVGNCMHEDNEEDSKDLCSLCNKAYPSTYNFAYRPDGSNLFYCWNDCLK